MALATSPGERPRAGIAGRGQWEGIQREAVSLSSLMCSEIPFSEMLYPRCWEHRHGWGGAGSASHQACHVPYKCLLMDEGHDTGEGAGSRKANPLGGIRQTLLSFMCSFLHSFHVFTWHLWTISYVPGYSYCAPRWCPKANMAMRCAHSEDHGFCLPVTSAPLRARCPAASPDWPSDLGMNDCIK